MITQIYQKFYQNPKTSLYILNDLPRVNVTVQCHCQNYLIVPFFTASGDI